MHVDCKTCIKSWHTVPNIIHEQQGTLLFLVEQNEYIFRYKQIQKGIVTQLTEITYDFYLSQGARLKIHIISVHFAKAFDKLSK